VSGLQAVLFDAVLFDAVLFDAVLFDAVLFDMDGLAVDTEHAWLAVEHEVADWLGVPWGPEHQAALVGGSIEATSAYLGGRGRRQVAATEIGERLLTGMVEHIRRHGAPERPGARRLLAEVRAAGLPSALVTASHRPLVDAVLAATGLVFDVTVAGDEVALTKPAPDPYLRAAELLAADPRRCVVLEDSPNGVAAGEAAGCVVVGVPSIVPLRPGPGRSIVTSLEELSVPALAAAVTAAQARDGSRR
jgi:HAD superfamily hydrolase (TIGR01509 family)